MGIYDRDYYRNEGSGFFKYLNSGAICKWLIGINIAAIILQLLSPAFTEAFALLPQKVLDGQVWRLLTYAFLHSTSGVTHILFNMLFLWWFGSEVEDLLGPREFLSFYLLSALLGGLAFELSWKAGMMDPRAVCVGASGAVTAVLVLFAFHYPTRLVYIWFLFPIPVWFLVLFQVAQDTFGFLGGRNSAVAVEVHLAGAAFGFLYHRLHWRLSNIGSGWTSWWRQRSRPRLRVYREEEVARVPDTSASESNEQLEAKLDAVLEKVARFGQDSLTEQEKKILVQASEIYKRRRS